MAELIIHIPSLKYIKALDTFDKKIPSVEGIESEGEKFTYCPELWVKRLYSNIKGLGSATRIYFGSEFCQRLIPSLEHVREAIDEAIGRNLKFTLVTPYVTNAGIKKLEPLFKYLNDLNDRETEVVVNDPGTIEMITEYKNITPVLGRLKDPMKRMARFVHQMPEFNAAQQEAISSSDITIGVYREYLRGKGISRVEMDMVPQGIKINFKMLRMKASFYYPWTYITTGRICEMGSLNQEDAEKFTVYNPCQKECQKYYASWYTEYPGVSNKIFAFGNTIFMLCETPASLLKKYVDEQGFDRIIYQPVIPV